MSAEFITFLTYAIPAAMAGIALALIGILIVRARRKR